MKKLLFLSTPVGGLGTGLGGGVELTIKNLAQEMQARGYEITIIAPQNSHLTGIEIREIEGTLQIFAQTQTRNSPVMVKANSVLANMWEYARKEQHKYDLLVNFAFDWLPFYLTPFFQAKIAHFISMGSMSEALDQIMGEIGAKFRGSLGVYTKAQANTFPFADLCRCLGSGIDLSLYEFCAQPSPFLAWLGRIAPEKALEDALEASQITGIPLRIFGKIQDSSYWQHLCNTYSQAANYYRGFFQTVELQQELRQAQGLLMTPRWMEAFGNVAIEALACGVPVISYARGGPTEIIRDGETGFLVEPDRVQGLVDAIQKLPAIDRFQCRQQAEKEYSLPVWGDRFEAWFKDLEVERIGTTL
jgi:UDP-glucose:tetrahydrobiopterin glucosyltransferase